MNDDAPAPGPSPEAPTEPDPIADDAVVAEAPLEPEAHAPTLAEGSPEALFEALWGKVLASWDDDKPHASILEYALRSERLPELAGRYRAETTVPGHEARAQKRLDAIVVAATQLLFAQRAPKREKAPWQLTVGVGLVCVLVLVWLAFKVIH